MTLDAIRVQLRKCIITLITTTERILASRPIISAFFEFHSTAIATGTTLHNVCIFYLCDDTNVHVYLNSLRHKKGPGSTSELVPHVPINSCQLVSSLKKISI